MWFGRNFDRWANLFERLLRRVALRGHTWEVINAYTGNTWVSYSKEAEALDEWNSFYGRNQGLVLLHFDRDGNCVS